LTIVDNLNKKGLNKPS
jgi:hypothetical protein